MIVAGIQMDIAWEDPEANFRKVEALVEEASPSEPRLLVLPEMFATGFSMRAREMAAMARETRAFLSDLSSRRSLFILGGYAEPSDPLPSNACSIFDPKGEEILHYRKLHPFSLAGEEEHYLPGDSLPTAVLEGLRVTPLICYDLRFPEPFRGAALGTDLYCVIANWPDKRRQAWTGLLRARAIENQAYVMGVNRVGMGSGEAHAGDSVLLDPMGEVVAEMAAYEEGVFVGRIEGEKVAGTRERLPFLEDRRPKLYRRLEDAQG